MNLIEAINHVAKGYIVFSNKGKAYDYSMLQPKWYGKHYASFKTSGMAEYERKGEFRLK
jgi:hypothetical protein